MRVVTPDLAAAPSISRHLATVFWPTVDSRAHLSLRFRVLTIWLDRTVWQASGKKKHHVDAVLCNVLSGASETQSVRSRSLPVRLGVVTRWQK